MTIAIQIVTGILFGFACFLFLADIFKLPYRATIKSVMGLESQMNEGNSKINSGLESIAIWLAKVIKINPYKRAQMVSDLRTSRMDITPEMFLANGMVKAGVVAIIGIPILPIFWWLSLIVFFMAGMLYLNHVRSLAGRIKEKRKAIEYELPRLVFTIEKTLRHSRDVLLMLETYQNIAGPELKHELTITTADMRSGNYETAITRMESRVGSSMMSDICRGLISVMRGDETMVYWQSLELKLENHQREMLKAKAEKGPRKVNKLSMIMLICFMMVWVVVMGVQIITSLGSIFGVM